MILKRNYSKKLFISSLLILFSTLLFCATAKYQDENFSLIVNYTETVTPGDAIFVRLNIQPTGELKKHKSEIATNSLSMLRHQKYPYQNILENFRKKQPDLPNLYNVLLSYQITKTNTDGFNYETRWAFNNNCADDMQIHILDLNDFGSVNIFYDYKTQKFDTTEIDNIHNRILHIIEQVLNNNL